MNLFILFYLLAITFKMPTAEAQLKKDPFNGLVWNRDNYQKQNGKVDRSDWYEWWYFKLIDAKTNAAFYFIYGVVNPWDFKSEKPASRAFVQFGNFKDKWIIEQEFPVQKFDAKYGNMNVRIDQKNWANKLGAGGHIQGISSGQEVEGSSAPQHHEVRWNLSTLFDWRFDAMGWTMDLDWSSNIYWYPAQASVWMNGTIEIDGVIYNIENAEGYQDRNWGRTFPKWWAWIVSSNFKNSPGTRLAGGGGLPQVLNAVTVPVFVLGLRHKNKEYSFRLSSGDSVKMNISFGKWLVTATNKNGDRVVLEGHGPKEKIYGFNF